MKKFIKALLILGSFCFSQISFAKQPETLPSTFASKALGYAGKGLRLGFKGADRVVGFGLMAREGYKNFNNYKMLQSLTLSDFKKELEPIKEQELTQEFLDLKNKLCNRMGIDQNLHIETRITRLPVPENMAFVGVNFIGKDPILIVNNNFLKLPIDQQEVALAHEFTHLQNNDPETYLKVKIATPLVAIVGGYGTAYALRKMHSKEQLIPAQNTFTKAALRFKGRTLPAILSSALAQYGLSFAMDLQYGRFFEKRADINAVKVTGKAQSFIDFLTDFKEKRTHYLKSLEKFSPLQIAAIEQASKVFDYHPSEDTRIAYLKPYTQQPKPEREYTDLPISC